MQVNGITNLTIKLSQLNQAIDQVMPQLYQNFYQNTPVKTGNAKANTLLQGRTIRADYAYAGVLDAGRGWRDGQMRGSVQAPNGMSQSTIQLARQLIIQKIQQIGI
jgi:hypothetical protein